MKMLRTCLALVAGLSGLIAWSLGALAWGNEGHEAIGLIAENFLEPAVHKQVAELLSAPSDPALPSTIRDRATWADKYRDSGRNKPAPNRYTETHLWHFVDIDIHNAPDFTAACFGDGKATAPASKGSPDDCVVRKIEQFSAELRDKTLAKEERTLALMFILHFVGDVHQPLHAAHAIDGNGKSDAGGNLVPILVEGRELGDNLHSYWDNDAVESLGSTPELVAQRLLPEITKENIAEWTKPDPKMSAPRSWALESYEIAKSMAYVIPAQTHPCKVKQYDKPPKDDHCHLLLPHYAAQASDQARQQIKMAGVRLAHLLNETLR